MATVPMHAAEIAQRLGVTTDTFYKNREKYRLIDGMPAPIANVGRMAWDRDSMEVWLRRHDPRLPKTPTNDIVAPLQPHNDEQWNAYLHQQYGQPAE